MKKFLAASLVAIALIASTQQQASAWVKWNFGFNFDVGYSSGGNSLLWGAWQNGQVPNPYGFDMPYHHGHQHQHHHHSALPTYTPYAFAPFEFQYAAPSYSPYQYAANPGPVYYYPMPYYGR